MSKQTLKTLSVILTTILIFAFTSIIALYNLERTKMPLTIIKEFLDTQPLKVKFFTAAYSYEVDNYLNEEMEKFLHEDLAKFRSLHGTPALFISSGKDVLIAVPFKEVELDDEQVVSRIIGMEEDELQGFANWEKVIKELQDKGYTIGTR